MSSVGTTERLYYQRVLELAGQVSTIFKLVFQKNFYIDCHVENLIQLVDNILATRPSNEVFFGLLGHKGCGKSTLINAGLGVFDIARKDGNTGLSCTWMVQEFRQSLPDQTAPFRAEILFYDDIALAELFALMVSELLIAITPEKSHGHDQQEDDEPEKAAKRGSTHIKTLRALFHDKPEFETSDTTKRFISQAQSEEGSETVKRMTMWAGELIRQATTVFLSTTQGDLLQQLRNYTHGPVDQEDDEHVYWPLVKRATFYLTGCPLLEHGVVLIDSPGSHDTNSIQGLASRRALRACDYYVAVADVIRALSDDTLGDCLEEGYRRKKVLAVLTKIDHIDVSLTTRQAVLTAQLEDLQEQRLHARREGRQEEKAAILLKEEAVEDELRKVKKEESKSIAIMERNSRLIKELREDYKARTGDERPLDIFPVASKMSEQHQRGLGRGLDLTNEQTGIQAFQDYLVKTTLDGRFNDANHLYQTQLPLAFGRMDLYRDKRHFAHKGVLERIVQGPAAKYGDYIQSFLDSFQERVKNLLEVMRKHEHAWNKKGLKLCYDWDNRYGTGPYHALVKLGGVKGKMRNKIPATNCNKDLAAIVKRSITADIELLIDFADKQQLRMITIFKEPLTDIEDALRKNEKTALLLPKSLLSQFGLHKQAMVVPVDKCFADLREELRNIGRDLTTYTGDSIVTQCMKPVYVEVASIVGRGSGTLRPEKMEELVGSLWPSVREETKLRYTKAFEKCSQGLSAVVETTLQDIQSGFDAFCQEKKFEEKGEVKLRKHLSQALIEAKKIYNGPLRETMAQYKMNMLPEEVKKEEH